MRALASAKAKQTGLFTEKEEQGSGRMFFCKEKRSKANFAPTWCRWRGSNPHGVATAGF